jgi:hypothetical protein
MSDNFVKDVLLQIQEQQTTDAQTLGRILGAIEGQGLRINKLEAAQSRQWWVSYVITPFSGIAYALAHKFGVKI